MFRIICLKSGSRKLKCREEKHIDQVLVQVAVPSRGDISEYQKLKRNVHELVGGITGKHTTLDKGPPVIYLDQSIEHEELAALYRVADVCLITSLRDGMNLVSYSLLHENLFKRFRIFFKRFNQCKIASN